MKCHFCNRTATEDTCTTCLAVLKNKSTAIPFLRLHFEEVVPKNWPDSARQKLIESAVEYAMSLTQNKKP